MKYKFLDRSALKWIALITMLIDHCGAVFGSEFYEGLGVPWLYVLIRIIGRVSFPIFAFFIAEGWHYTRSKKRYALTMLIFACISQPIYYFALNKSIFEFNIFFTFLCSIAIMYLIDSAKNNKSLGLVYFLYLIILVVIIEIFSLLGMSVVYGLAGVVLPVVFYLFNHSEMPHAKVIMFVFAGIVLVLIWLQSFVPSSSLSLSDFTQLFALLSIPILITYNGKKGKHSFKWLFYVFYPAHILLLYLIKLLITI